MLPSYTGPYAECTAGKKITTDFSTEQLFVRLVHARRVVMLPSYLPAPTRSARHIKSTTTDSSTEQLFLLIVHARLHPPTYRALVVLPHSSKFEQRKQPVSRRRLVEDICAARRRRCSRHPQGEPKINLEHWQFILR